MSGAHIDLAFARVLPKRDEGGGESEAPHVILSHLIRGWRVHIRGSGVTVCSKGAPPCRRQRGIDVIL